MAKGVDPTKIRSLDFRRPRPRSSPQAPRGEPTKVSIGARAERFAADHGHIIVRVEPGGAAFRVFVLDDMRQDYCVTGTFGPYTARD